jgi:hypothetical protein
MKPVADPQKDPIALRDLAKRARRLAAGLTQAADSARLNRYADELEQRAAVLEAQAQAAAPPPRAR